MKNNILILAIFISLYFQGIHSAFGLSAEELLHMGNVSSKQENFPQAISYYKMAIESDPHMAKAYYNRGYAYMELKKYKLAINDLNFAIEIDPQYAAAYHIRGVTYFFKKKYQKSVNDYSKAIELDPDNLKLYFSRLSAYCKLGYIDKAWKDVIKIQGLGGTVNPEIINLLKGKKYRE